MPLTMQESEADWSTTTSPKSPAGSVTVQAGDFVVLAGITADQTATVSTPTGGGLTYTLQGSVNMGSNCWIGVWTAPVPSSQTFTFSVSRSATAVMWGYNALILTGGSAIGAVQTGNGTGAPAITMTPQSANSAVVAFFGDWNAADGTSRTWLTNGGAFTEQTYFRDSAQYTVYGGAHLNAGTATSKSFGLSAPTGTKWVGALVEVKASAGSPGPIGYQRIVPQAVRRAATY